MGSYSFVSKICSTTIGARKEILFVKGASVVFFFKTMTIVIFMIVVDVPDWDAV